jgi:hypothetical protein
LLPGSNTAILGGLLEIADVPAVKASE